MIKTLHVGPYAEVILDSYDSSSKSRLTTIRGICHRFVLAELNTHRAFSRNSASSRAKSLKVTIDEVTTNVAYPLVWASEKRGMSGGEPLDNEMSEFAIAEWESAAQNAVYHAERLRNLGVHKSIVNRLLEPFMWHEVLITSTHWQNFFRQRCSSNAQPEMRVFAEYIRDAYVNSEPIVLGNGEWHLPFVTSFGGYTYDEPEIRRLAAERAQSYNEIAARVSSARCARVSYKTLDGVLDRDADLALFARLENPPADSEGNAPMHLSPMEHVARQAGFLDILTRNLGANFGPTWVQFRQIVEKRNGYTSYD